MSRQKIHFILTGSFPDIIQEKDMSSTMRKMAEKKRHSYNYVPLNKRSAQFKQVLKNEIDTAKQRASHTVIFINGDNSETSNQSLWLPQLIALKPQIFDVTMLVCNNPNKIFLHQLRNENVHTINMETVYQKNTFTERSTRGLLEWVYDLTQGRVSSDQALKDKEQAWSKEDIKRSEKFSNWETKEDAAIKREIQRKHDQELHEDQMMKQHRIEQNRNERQRMERARYGPESHAQMLQNMMSHRNDPPSARNHIRQYPSMRSHYKMPEDNPYTGRNASIANRRMDTNDRMDTMTRDHRMDTSRPLKMQSKMPHDSYDNKLAANLTTAVMNCMREGC